MKKQPALKSYCFGKGYFDLKNTFVESWRRNLASTQHYRKEAKFFWYYQPRGFWRFMAIGALFVSISIGFFGTLFFFLFSLIHFTLLITISLFIYLAFNFLRGIDKLYRLWRRTFIACPLCYHKTDIPHYLCPSCQRVHTRLLPSSYGTFNHRCLCGNRLPTTFLNGRNQLPTLCPKCHHEINTKQMTPLCIPIVGGPSVGKTSFLFAAVKNLVEEIAPQKGWQIRFLDEPNKMLYQQMSDHFEQGIVPAKTSELMPMAFNFVLKSSQKTSAKIIYFYDVAGEVFQQSEVLGTHKFYDYFHGIIFIIDPFSIPELMIAYQNHFKQHAKTLKPSDMMLDDAFDMMILNLEKNYQVKPEQTIKKPCAIVINKIDAFDLQIQLGEKAAQALMQQDKRILTLPEALNKVCKDHFIAWGLGHFIRNLEHKFENYQFFTCSALGNYQDGKAFESKGVTEPLLWLLNQIEKN
jgi:GTPase SAR1 family protein